MRCNKKDMQILFSWTTALLHSVITLNFKSWKMKNAIELFITPLSSKTNYGTIFLFSLYVSL